MISPDVVESSKMRALEDVRLAKGVWKKPQNSGWRDEKVKKPGFGSAGPNVTLSRAKCLSEKILNQVNQL
jgi:hypothetical protein